MSNSHVWISLVRAAERLMTYRPGGLAYELAHKSMLRDLESVCPDAFRVVVAEMQRV